MKQFLIDEFWFLNNNRHKYGYKIYQKIYHRMNKIMNKLEKIWDKNYEVHKAN